MSYDRLSPCYDILTAPERRLETAALDMLAPREGECVLEIGCGTGRALVRVAERVGENGEACGVDRSPRMVRRARRRIRTRGLSPRAAVLPADARRLPFPPGRFDALFLSFTLELFDAQEIPAVLRECRRVMRPDGRLALVSLSAEGGPSPLRGLYRGARRVFPSVLDCRPIAAARVLRENGLRPVVAKRRLLWGMPVEVVVAGMGEV